MATLAATVLTILDVQKGMDPDGAVATVVEILNQSNQILLDMDWQEGNLPTGHQTTIRTGLPSVYFRLLNAGVVPSKGTKAQIMEQCGILESWIQMDCDVANLGGNPGAVRLSEAKAHLEAMNQEMAYVLFYGNQGLNPEQYTGFATRYSSLSAGNSQNIINGGGTASSNTSVWLVVWGENTVHGIFPKGSVGGLTHYDFGEMPVIAGSSSGIGVNALMRAYQEQFQWKGGLCIKDWRYVVRVCNIDVNNLTSESSPTDLWNKMTRAYHRIPFQGMGKAAWYMNRTVFEMLDIQRREDVKGGGQLKYEEVDGVTTATFKGIPIRRTDTLLTTEAAVS